MLNSKGLNRLKLLGLLLLVLCWFSFSSTPLWAESNPEWIEFIPGTEKAPQINVLGSNFEQVVLDIQIFGMWSEEVATKGGIFNRLSIPECGITNVIGEPNLPMLRKMIQIPYGAEVDVEVISSEFEEKSLEELGILNRIIPIQPPIPKIEGAWEAAEFVIHEAAYQTNSFYPTELAKKGEIGIIRGHRFVTVEISPVSYNPVSAKLKVYSYVRVRVNLSGSNRAKTEDMLYRYASPPFEEMCRDMFINYSAYQDIVKGAPDLPIGYLIIVHNDFEAQAAPLAEWKRKKGFHVTVATTTETGTSTTSIKNYISEAYNNWPIRPTYVLFFGDVGWIPTYNGTYSYSATDLYYVQMNADRFADIYRARFPVRNTTEATDMVNKLLYYENPTSPDMEWMRHECFLASSDYGQMAEFTHRYVIQNYVVPNGGIVDTVWQRLGGGTQDIFDCVNGGTSVLCYSGHGYSGGWGCVPFNQTNVQNLSNANEYPLVLSHACTTNPFDQTECYGETWVKEANKGAIAFWGASASSYWDEDDILEKRMFEAAFDDACYSVVAMTDMALWYLSEYYGGGGRTNYYFDMYNVNGDPSVDIWTYIADGLVVTFPGTIPMLPSFAVEITVETTSKGPLFGALVCLRKGAEVFETGYTDSSGQVTLYVSPTTVGYMELTITAHNQLPFEGSINVNPPGAYVTFESYSIDDDSLGESQGNDDGKVDFAETIELFIDLKNSGDSSAHDVYAILSTTHPLVNVIDDYAFWGEIPSGGTVTSQDAFVFFVSPDIPDLEVITFQLDIQATNGSWTYDDVTIVAHAPVLVYSSKETDDIGGNGNGKPDPGETCDMTITLKNDGSQGEIQVTADLVSYDPYVTITVSSASYPDIPAGGTGSSLTPYRFTVEQDCPLGHKASMILQISGWGPYYTEETFDVLIGQRPILFVDDDGGKSYESYFIYALDSVGSAYDVWTYETQGCPADSVLELYQAVVWSTGDDYGSFSDPATLNATDQARLMTYLDNGGCLFFSSQDFLLDNNPNTFITNYLHVAGHDDDETITSVAGILEDTISDGMSLSLSYPFYNFSDHIVPGAGAVGIFYETSKAFSVPREGVQIDRTSEAGAGAGLVDYCALRYPASGSSIYKVVFFSFPFEAVPQTGTYPNNSYTLMRRITSWFGVGKPPTFTHGDANGDGMIDLADVVFLISYLYKGGIPPTPLEAGDVNCDGEINLADVVYLINYLYRGGPAPPC
ncbi:MAG: hypothetical protein KAW02_02575 [candidate division Zixibacteria bacterium]|nr:hypothetical protein [candidate division Zixibacteria bacterium]